MAKQSRSNSNSTDHYPLYPTNSTTSSGQQMIMFSTTPDYKNEAHYYETKLGSGALICDTELSPVCSCNESVSSYLSCDDQYHKQQSFSIRTLVVTEPYWKRVGKVLDNNKKNIMMGCIMFVLVSLFIVSTVYFVKSLLMNNIVILTICAIMSLLAALIISVLGIIWLTKHSRFKTTAM
ncbi:hypothetical protein NAEGRDRAFT_79401 [Naegleria gruberi]|uniref:Uncharacterized protein n=1 Tax=Naegleria gruberi TaxID=5762 RepID=D2VC72_NAEGR|nr:uncharacterized protein NAEGRDRAFT_79401 [Naegleria gruberi]EFC45606.1 hypothetical protein NAEGRDRAFT_79401 [Naegleria gruberi]|eukprot:XP_002678350.1 hypothetical protein NAEGRDRAFT_79401 [Naegleria gruberi strain NEG-M]